MARNLHRPGRRDRRDPRLEREMVISGTPFAQLRDAELQVTGLGRQRLGPVAVAFRHASLDASITAGAEAVPPLSYVKRRVRGP
jgi:hypothetical protein